MSGVVDVHDEMLRIHSTDFEIVCMSRYVLTQFNSHTLNTHIAENYPPIVFGGPQKRGFVDVLTASQTPKSANWYKGSADAVRQQLDSILDAFRGMNLPDELLVLSGQAIYKMVCVLALPQYLLHMHDMHMHDSGSKCSWHCGNAMQGSW